MLQGYICSCISPIICRSEDITNFHGRLILNNGKSIRYLESPYYPILLNSFYFPINILVLAVSANNVSLLLLYILFGEYPAEW